MPDTSRFSSDCLLDILYLLADPSIWIISLCPFLAPMEAQTQTSKYGVMEDLDEV